MLKRKHKIKVINLRNSFVNASNQLLQLDCDNDELIMLIEDGIDLCDNVLRGSIKAKHFNDHIKLISVGLDSYEWFQIMRERNLIAEE